MYNIHMNYVTVFTFISVSLHVMVCTSPKMPIICVLVHPVVVPAKSQITGGLGSITGGMLASILQSVLIQPSSHPHTPTTLLPRLKLRLRNFNSFYNNINTQKAILKTMILSIRTLICHTII